MISCVAIDDEPLALEIITAYCRQIPGVTLLKTFTDTREASHFLGNFPVDLLIIDIQMPDQDGITFYKKLDKNIPVIFCTAFSEYAVEGFNLSAVDYLLKPVSLARFEQALKKAADYLHYVRTGDGKARHLFVRAEYSLVKIAFDEIEYIETLDDYIRIHLAGKKPVLSKMNLKSVLNRLDPSEFVRVHRSFIVPISRIEAVRNKTVILPGTSLPVGVKFYEAFMAAYMRR